MAARFYSGGAQGEVDLSTTIQDIVTGQTNSSDVRRLILINTGSTDRNVQLYDENDKLIDNVLVPANAGVAPTSAGATRPAIDVLNGAVIAGSELDAYGNRFYRLYSASKIRAKQIVGTDCQLQWARSDYEA